MAIKVEKIEKELNIQELLILEVELSGKTFPTESGSERVIKGVIEEKLHASVKMHLLSFLSDIESIKKTFYKVRDELIRKYGKISVNENGIESFDLNENMNEFRKEETDLLSQTFKIKVPVFDIDDLFDFKTDYVYAYSFKFLVKEYDES